MDKYKILLVYFSSTGITKRFSKYISEALNIKSYQIKEKKPYTQEDYGTSMNDNTRCQIEQRDDKSRPEIITDDIPNLDNINIIILGFPIWSLIAPRVVQTFLEYKDLSGKRIIPFATSWQSPIGDSEIHLHNSCPKAIWDKAIVFNQTCNKNVITNWAKQLKL